MQEQFELMRKLVERKEEPRKEEPRKAERSDAIKLTKLTDQDDIEAYLTVFERMMEAYEVAKPRWAFMLAPQLTGATDASDHTAMKASILQRYDINEETYRQRLHAAKIGNGESLPVLQEIRSLGNIILCCISS